MLILTDDTEKCQVATQVVCKQYRNNITSKHVLFDDLYNIYEIHVGKKYFGNKIIMGKDPDCFLTFSY